METYQKALGGESTLILTTDSDFYRYLKQAIPDVKQNPRSGAR